MDWLNIYGICVWTTAIIVFGLVILTSLLRGHKSCKPEHEPEQKKVNPLPLTLKIYETCNSEASHNIEFKNSMGEWKPIFSTKNKEYSEYLCNQFGDNYRLQSNPNNNPKRVNRNDTNIDEE